MRIKNEKSTIEFNEKHYCFVVGNYVIIKKIYVSL